MNGMQRPTIFLFIDNYKKDESIARGKIINCLANKEPPKKSNKQIAIDLALKRSVQNYLETERAAKEAAEKAAIEAAEKAEEEAADQTDDDTEEEDSDNDENDDIDNEAIDVPNIGHEQNGWAVARAKRNDWLKTPAMVLLSAVSHHLRA